MQALGNRSVAFTSSYPGLSRELVNEVRICEAFDPSSPPNDTLQAFEAVWDTGATNSLITSDVVSRCNLKPSGRAIAHTPQGSHEVDTYLVGIVLPNNVAVPTIRVSEGILSEHDVLIGMDIIARGDFAVTNKDGKTVFSFRMPSLERIDFVNNNPSVQAITAPSPPKIGRNEKCPCGSGKKYKRCCGAAPQLAQVR